MSELVETTMKHAETKHAKPKEAAPEKPAPTQSSPVLSAAITEPQATIGQTELDALREKAKLADVNWDKFLRAAADLENYKKRAARERDEAVRRERETLVARLLPLLDSLETGLAAMQGEPAVVAGMQLVQKMFTNFLAECGVEEIAAVGVPFDPILHHAVSQESSDKIPHDLIIRQTRKGYRVGERVLRAAEVVVSYGAPQEKA